MSDNRRSAPRKDAFRVANLSADGRADALECLIWDVSETGAQVEVAADAVVPDRFTLRITAYEPPRRCRVVRRDGRRLGVHFEA
ncbi:PilZ domain-containing protein [uncultured Methylobacterium sp.]|uniref:PilZ domain-containing protein n=1 Tax=uncultured Methylobacterium sp. TaxID=157278 RepID=UPI0035C9EE44